ncbi:cadherin repeat domain-containing protein [Aequorivita lipolytica]|uniref:Cadherin repeat domain-containing protein n=1 Tax=Aequorivita lipolytica TaxID=153267 RepID=A0A5C6YR19_9FLAO|nr:cadherin repeat domain-containing protein [Aequorivita lipolytica]TXD69434.1 cadherin repeat domain-containing protein [Aequorivita lipolytica]SRX50906.1 hypothetical protein AEQU2_01385 [Aequorivita lipolytica]
MNRILPFKLTAAIIFFTFFSCSKDSDGPIIAEVTVTTSDFSKTMDENPTNAQVIGIVSASTNEGSVTFSITEQTPSGAYTIDAISGELKVADETLFDFETNPTITGIIKVANGTVSENALVTVTLNDLVEDNIYEGDVILKSQQEVDDFGANNYTQINGFLIIGKRENEGYSDITDLTALQSTKIINGIFQIKNNAVLATTNGLNLDFILGLFEISNNSSLESVIGLNNITSLSSLSIVANNSLTDLSGLSQIVEIQHILGIGFCPEIINLDWANNIISVEAIGISNCHALTNIDGLSNLTNINLGYNHISISENNSLQNLNGLQNLNDTLIFLEIRSNPSLKNINGLANTNYIRNIIINNNDSLENLDGLTSVTSLGQGGLSITYNNTLRNIEGLINLDHVDGYIGITGNENLISLNGLESLSHIEGIGITENTNLIDFCSLINVLTIDPNTNYQTYNNAYNPTKQDIIDGNCSL